MVQSVKDVAAQISARVVEAIVNSVLSLYKYVCMTMCCQPPAKPCIMFMHVLAVYLFCPLRSISTCSPFMTIHPWYGGFRPALPFGSPSEGGTGEL